MAIFLGNSNKIDHDNGISVGMPSNSFIETLTLPTHYVITPRPCVLPSSNTQISLFPSIPRVTDVLQATVILSGISIQPSQ